MENDATMDMAAELMTEFANQTGLSQATKVARRYLWTDAFAVCNFLQLYRQTSEDTYKNLALHLVNQVHNILGRHREDDPRTGWISGLNEQEGKIHPTKGGLRIGKQMNERRPSDPFDERLEWDRDGQYYHYLTKWMHALNRVSRVIGDSTYNIMAIELAKTAHARFTYVPSLTGQKHMYWKMNIDLSYPLVEPMGHQDPLDGFITYNQLQTTAAGDSESSTWQNLNTEIMDMATICKGKNWATDDSLGIGGLMCDAFRVAQLIINHNFKKADLLEILLDSSLLGLEAYTKNNPLKLPAEYRLAFRELGLSIGLRSVDKLHTLVEKNLGLFDKRHPTHTRIENLRRYASLVETIEHFWLEATNRETNSWREHQDINMVMLATSLNPDGYLII